MPRPVQSESLFLLPGLDFDRGPSGRGLRVAGAAWRWGSSRPRALRSQRPRRACSGRVEHHSMGGARRARRGEKLLAARGGTVPRAPGRISGGWTLSTRMPTRRDADGRAARAASMVWCRLGRHFAPVRQGVNHPVCADMSGLRGPVPLRCVLPSSAGQDHRSWVRPVASGPPVCPSSDFRASSQSPTSIFG